MPKPKPKLECTFAPRSRDRYHCNRCGGKTLKKAQLDGHSRTARARRHMPHPGVIPISAVRKIQRIRLSLWSTAYDCPECERRHTLWEGHDIVCKCGARIHVE